MAQTIPELLREFEMSLAASNPDLLNSLRRGAPEAKLRKKLSSANVEGNVDPVVSLFSWRDGTNFDRGNSLEKSSPFPESTYIFMDFSMMLAHFQGFNEAAVYHPRFKDIVGRYFPVFWDGSDNWIAIDISPTGNGRVVFLITQSENIVCEAYSSLEALILDAIRANRDATELSCFSRLSSSAAHTELCCTFCREPKSKVGSLVFSKHSASICCACLATASQLAKSKGAALELPPKPLVDVYWEQ